MRIVKDKRKLKELILSGITSEELNSKYDYSSIKEISFMFNKGDDLKNITHFSTSGIIDMSWMFYGCEDLESIPVLDTSNVKRMSYMFDGCINLRNIDPYNYTLYDFSKLDNPWLKKYYPELYI